MLIIDDKIIKLLMQTGKGEDMYNCPGCGAELQYDIRKAKLHCDNCDGYYDMKDEAFKYASNDDFMKSFRCSQCGGELYANSNSIAAFCSFCGSSNVMHETSFGRYYPKKIVPFTRPLEECTDSYFGYAKKAWFVPKDYKDGKNALSFRGIYVPYHAYEVNVSGDYVCNAKSDRQTPIGDGKIKHHITEYRISEKVEGKVSGIVHDASKTFADDQSELISDDGLNGAVDFDPGYLCGFYADYADVPANEYMDYSYAKAHEIVRNKVEEHIDRSTFEQIEIKAVNSEPYIAPRHSEDVLKPVWFMGYRSKKRMAYATINGNNGNIVCDMPVDTKKLVLVSLIVSALAFVLLNLFVTFRPKIMLNIAAIADLILAYISYKNTCEIYNREIHRNYSAVKKKEKKGLAKPGLLGLTGATWMVIAVYFVVISMTQGVYLVIELFTLIMSVRVFIILLTLMPQFVLLLMVAKKFTLLWANNSRLIPGILLTMTAGLISLTVSIINPVDDIWYYIAVIISLLITVVVIVGLVFQYNIICTRPLPQFTLYRGGVSKNEVD